MNIRNVFIIMPFEEQRLQHGDEVRIYPTEHLDDVYTILQEAIADYDEKIDATRMDQPYGNLVSAIIQRLSSADVVIAILAGKNPNVFYELGIRHSLRLNTIMLVEEWDEYPFDLKSYFSHRYSISSVKGRSDLRQFVQDRLTDIAKRGSLPDSPVLDELERSEYEQHRVINHWETRRAAMILDGVMREILAVNDVLGRCVTAAYDARKSGSREKLRRVRLSWDTMDGFTKNRPILGLPSFAYQDAEIIYSEWRQFERRWNRALEIEMDPLDLVNVVAASDRLTIAFTHDVSCAWEHVRSHRRAFGIPWGNSMDDAEKLIKNIGTLQDVRTKVLGRASDLMDSFEDFEKEFVGFPGLVASDVEQVQSAADDESFTSLVSSVATGDPGSLDDLEGSTRNEETRPKKTGATRGKTKTKRKKATKSKAKTKAGAKTKAKPRNKTGSKARPRSKVASKAKAKRKPRSKR